MEILYRLARGNALPRLLVGIFIALFLYGAAGDHPQRLMPPTQSFLKPALAAAAPASLPDYSDRLIELARTDHVQLFRWAMENYDAQVRDYSATFVKQERINGKLNPSERIDVQFLDKPFSVLMQWQENPGMVDKLLYAEGHNDNQMIVHPTGLLSWIKSVKRDPYSKEAQQSSRRTCDRFGYYRTMQDLLAVYELACQSGDLQIGYLGKTKVNGRTCVAMERLLPAKPEYPYARLVTEFDVQYLLPTAISCYDWRGQLVSRYVYENLRFNVGLTPEMFTLAANGL